MSTGRPLKTQQVADALGIGVSTLKRWIDAGRLEVSRTVGRHRLIDPAEALRFARDQQFQTSQLEVLIAEGGEHGSAETFPDVEKRSAWDSRSVERLFDALKRDDRRESRRVILAAYGHIKDAAQLSDELICPVMRMVGDGWGRGEWDVFEEHQASQTVGSVVQALIEKVRPVHYALLPLAIGAAPEGDQSTLGLLLGELALREQGWHVKNLGANLPLKSLIRAVRSHRPALIFLSHCHLVDPIILHDELRLLNESAREIGAQMILGGRAMAPDLIRGIEGPIIGQSMAQLRDFGRQIRPNHQEANN